MNLASSECPTCVSLTLARAGQSWRGPKGSAWPGDGHRRGGPVGRNKFEFDVGTHYVGECGPGGRMQTALSGLALTERIKWLRQRPEGHCQILVPGTTFQTPTGWDTYLDRLVAAFPEEESGLRRCVRIMRTVAAGERPLLRPFALLRWGVRPITTLMDACGLSADAQAVILAENGDYTWPPRRTPTFESDAEAPEKVKSLTGGRGASVVLDFVGADVTGNLAVACGGVGPAVVVIGAGMGGAKIGLTSSPYNMTVSTSLWGRRKELLELVEMAKRGQVNIKTTTYPIEDGEKAYDDMHSGKIVGRAVVVP